MKIFISITVLFFTFNVSANSAQTVEECKHKHTMDKQVLITQLVKNNQKINSIDPKSDKFNGLQKLRFEQDEILDAMLETVYARANCSVNL